MRSWSAAPLAWGLWATGIAFAAVASVFLVISIDAPTPEGHFGFRGFAGVFALAFGTVGALVASRHPSNPIGWIFVAMGVASGLQELADEYGIYAYLGGGDDLPLRAVAAWISSWIWIPPTSAAMFLLLLFPDGRLLSSRWRRAMVLGVGGSVAATVSFALAPGPLENFHAVENPFGILPSGAARLLGNGGITAYGLAMILAAISLVVRFRRSRGEERQQLKWLAASGLFLSLALVTSFTSVIGPGVAGSQISLPIAIVVIAGFVSLPVATGIAILKHRLFDIDVVISKTVVYALLAAFITIVYVAIVIGIGTLVGARGDPFLSAVAAAVVALAFQPVRRRAQRFANRLVYGKRATPYEVLSELSERFAGTYSLDDALPRMVRILAEATGAARTDVLLAVGTELRPEATWPRDGEPAPALPLRGDTFPALPGADLTVPVRHADRLLGALAVTKRGGEPLTPTEEKLVHDLAGQAGLVLRNVALVEDLRASRQRLVAAQDQERRRLERNIHDGAQQQLVALSVKARLASQLADRDPAKTQAMLEDIQREIAEALDDLRDLARGIYPPLLADRGLPEALEAQGWRVPLPVTVVADRIGRYEQDVEGAVYFCVLEALQNTTKYANATGARVRRLAETNGGLEFVVTDDGVGFEVGTRPRGSGLQNMADRLSVLGGTLEVVSAPGGGTTVTGRVPARPLDGGAP